MGCKLFIIIIWLLVAIRVCRIGIYLDGRSGLPWTIPAKLERGSTFNYSIIFLHNLQRLGRSRGVVDNFAVLPLPSAAEAFEVVEVALETVPEAEEAACTRAPTLQPRHILGQGLVGIHHPCPVAVSTEVAAVGWAVAERTGAPVRGLTRRPSLEAAFDGHGPPVQTEDHDAEAEHGDRGCDQKLLFDRHGVPPGEDFAACLYHIPFFMSCQLLACML